MAIMNFQGGFACCANCGKQFKVGDRIVFNLETHECLCPDGCNAVPEGSFEKKQMEAREAINQIKKLSSPTLSVKELDDLWNMG